MGRRRKIGPQIADFIRAKHREGYRCTQIHNLLMARFHIHLDPSNVPRYYKPLQEVIKQNRLSTERRRRRQKKQLYDTKYHRFIRHIDEYIPQALDDAEELTTEELSSKLAEVAQKDPKIGSAVHLGCDTLQKKLQEYQRLPRAPPIYEVRPGVYALKE